MAPKIHTKPEPETAAMILAVVRHLSRWMPRHETLETPDGEGPDSDSNCHNSSYELSQGLEVIEHFGPFADTLRPPPAAQGLR